VPTYVDLDGVAWENAPMKINLRELFLIVVVVALVLGWWLDRRGLSRDNDRLTIAAAKLARLLTYHGWRFNSSESDLRLQRGELQMTFDLSSAQAKKISGLAEMKVETGMDPLAQPKQP
jgi:hypothetical protein